MTIEKLNELLKSDVKIINAIWKNSVVFSYFYEIKSLRENIPELFRNETLSIEQIKSYNTDFITKVKSKTEKANIGEFYISIKELEKQIDTHCFISEELKQKEEILSNLLKKLWQNFNDLIRNPSDYRKIIVCYDTFSEIDTIFADIINYQKSIERIIKDTEIKYKIDKQEEELIIQINDHDMPINEFAEKIILIEKIYNSCLDLFQINVIEFPLKIVKIEYSSLFSKIIGSKKAIDLMKYMFKNIFDLLFKKYTTEGKLERISLQYTMLEKQIHYFSELKSLIGEEKFEPFWKENQDMIKKATVNLSKSLTKLSEKVTNITIDDSNYSLAENEKALYLTKYDKKQIEQKIEP